ncbi:MAG: hypothetical protein LBK25_00365 [Treponema sp.]|jgi:hypothetical protein|nr:hypothetical protein [Treponema sp.]
MKKAFILGITVFIAVQQGFSQVFIGGGLSYQYINSKIGDSSIDGGDVISLSPLLGYRLGKMDIGIMFQYMKDTTTSNSYNGEMTGIGIGIFGDYNFLTIGNFSILGRANLQYLNVKSAGSHTMSISAVPYFIPYTEQNTIGISLSPILEYKLFKYLTLYTGIGGISFIHSWGKARSYDDYYYSSTEEDFTLTNFDLSVSNGITLGFYVFLNGT